MENRLKKPLYSLTVEEYIALMKYIRKDEPDTGATKSADSLDHHFTITQLQVFLSCSKVTIHAYKKKGLPYYRIGRKVLFKKSEVLEFMRNNVKRSIIQ